MFPQYVINHPAKTDRIIDTLQIFRYVGLDPVVVDGNDILPYKNVKNKNLSWRAAMESHRRAIRQVVLNHDRAAVIFEDDIDLDLDFVAMSREIVKRLPSDWNIAFLGE